MSERQVMMINPSTGRLFSQFTVATRLLGERRDEIVGTWRARDVWGRNWLHGCPVNCLALSVVVNDKPKVPMMLLL